MKRLLPALLALLMILSTACAGGDATTTDTTAPIDAATTAAPETDPPETELTHSIPDVKYDGYTVNYLTVTNYTKNFRLIAEADGETLNDAGYKRNLAVSELLGVDYEVTEVDVAKVATTLSNDISANTGSYDFVLPHASNGVSAMVTGGMLYNLYDLPVVDFSMPWWNGAMTDALSIKNKAFLASGDLFITWQGMNGIIFNKDYVKDLGITEDLYQTARDGKWTYDKMMEYASKVSADLNGDGKMTEVDRYGYLGNNNTGYSTVISQDQPLTTRDADGKIVLAMGTERMISIVEKYYELTHAPYTWMDVYGSTTYATSNYRSILIEGRSFFTELDIGGLYSNLREIEFNFGILPMPKFDETQEKYKVFCGAGLLGVPINSTENLERTGAIAEALSFYSYKYMRPAFFDIVLENKAVRDEDSYEMIRLLHEGKTFDIGYTMGSGDIYNMIKKVVIENNSTNFTSVYKMMEKVQNKNLEKLYNAIAD